ncbi:MAG TPA: hypothetical protein VFJ43_06930 [Bacteroidia bacterium]|nr:hypothetical protein [Bacteroidia bacterium]
MRNFFFLLLIPFLIISCGKKRKILAQGTESWPQDSVEFATQLYLDHDSAFYTWTDKSTGRLFLIEKSASLQDLKDSTYSAFYYHENGNLMKVKSYDKKIPGNGMEYYPDKKKKSESRFQNGNLVEYTSWWETGKVNIETKYLEGGKIIHNEYFENGNSAQQLEVDSLWSGTCVNFYENGKKKGEGTIFHKNPSGIWKMYDSLGNPKQDTFFLAEGPLKRK